MAAVRAQTMQMTTSAHTRSDNRPSAAITKAPSAKGSANTVCENRISRKKRKSELPNAVPD